MQLPQDPDELETLGFNAYDGAKQRQDINGLVKNRDVDILVDARAFSDGRVAYDKARKLVIRANAALKIACDNARGWLMNAKNLLIPTLGKKWSSAWADAGWNEATLSTPHGEDKLGPMLRAQKTYLTDNPTLAIAAAPHFYTAARADELLTAIEFANNNADTTGGKLLGVKVATAQCETAFNTRELTQAALERRLHNLHGELEPTLDPLSPFWIIYGFEQPGAVARPEAVAALTAELFGGGRGKLSWTGATRATHYQIWRQAQGASGYELYDRTDGATEYLFEGLTVGNKDKFKVRGVNDTNVGPFSPEVEVTVT
ncbi:MAG: fibronectin type III domain-containing protein [Verrucomicrobia bacterium]|nr:fibronectin type III domain-containing protein [Verrucomicrobiota bacterium]